MAAPSGPAPELQRQPPHASVRVELPIPGVESAKPLPVEIRWDVEASSLRQVFTLHELCFPVKYPVSFYSSLMTDQLITIVAYTRPADYERVRVALQSRPRGEEDCGDAVAEAPPSAEREAELLEIELYLESLEHQDMLNKEKKRKNKAEGGGADEEETEYTVVVGIVIGSLAYAYSLSKEGKPRLFCNPTGYLGSFGVLPTFRSLHIGSVLLDHFTRHLTQELDVYASMHLHYDHYRMVDLHIRLQESEAAQELERKKTDGDPVAAAAAAAAAAAGKDADKDPELGSWEELLYFFVPISRYFFGERSRRSQLRARGLTDADIDALIEQEKKDQEAREARAEMAANPIVQRGLGEVWLHCRAKDTKLLRFYEKRGYRLHRTLENYYEIDGVWEPAALLLYSAASGTGDAEPAGKAEKAATNAKRPRSNPLPPSYLSPRTYARVCNVDLRPYDACRADWRTADMEARQPKRTWMELIEEVSKLVNAVVMLSMIVYMYYRYRTTGVSPWESSS